MNFSNLFVVLKDGIKAAPPYATLAQAHAAGAVTLNYGTFVNTIITFIIIAIAMFILIKFVMNVQNKLDKPAPAAAPTTKECPQCCSTINVSAKRCPNCTSDL